MKKLIYLCGMMLLSLNIMAQIDPYDRNWIPIVQDGFNTPNRCFYSSFQDSEGKWIAFVPCFWPSGVTKDASSHQIYQYNQCVFDDVEGVLKLNATFIQDTPILCTTPPSYVLPPNLYGISYLCDVNHPYLYYYSGMIESPPKDQSVRTNNLPPPRFRYGFFEIRCKLPVHDGAFPAFWLWDADNLTVPGNQYYEEIDIFEVSRYFTDPSCSQWHHNPNPHGTDDINTFTTGIYFNNTGTSSGLNTSQARKYPAVSANTNLTDWHTFACEWLPEHVIWYCDGNVVNEYYNPDSIPRHPLALKTNYAIDRYALQGHLDSGSPTWRGSDSMIIDYINVYQLVCDCNNDETIACQLDLDTFNYAVKKSISITASQELVKVEGSEKVTFRATDYFTITGPFQVDSGGEMKIIMQSCPDGEE